MSSEDSMIRVTNLSKCYHIYDHPSDRLKQSTLPRLQRLLHRTPKQYFREFWALRDVSFEVKRGETVGIIGRNGSGKSTLLQLICGTLAPTNGSVDTNGRIAALLELGSGFNPEFSGRENVYMNANILGFTREQVDARFDDIVAFADIGKFIDQPVKIYSSGMAVRLAFAVIAHVDADILVIDEALAVGDVFFQQKCARFLRGFQDGGRTVLFVSHDTGSILRLCQSALLLRSGGRDPIIGDAKTVCKLYLSELYDDPERRMLVHKMAQVEADASDLNDSERILRAHPQVENIFAISPFRHDAESFGEGGAEIVDAGFVDGSGQRLTMIRGDDAVRFRVRVRAEIRVRWPAVGFMIKDRLGQYLFTEGTDLPFRHYKMIFEPGEVVDANFDFKMPILIQGKYTINVAVANGIGHDHVQLHWIHDALQLESLTSRLVHGIGGMSDLDITVQWHELVKSASSRTS